MSIVPTPFLFRFTLPVSRVDRLPRTRAPLLKLAESCHVPFPSEIEGKATFARLSLAWNPHGLAIEVTVQGRQTPLYCNPEGIQSSDAVRIWIDTRDTQTQHRASRFCHHFVAMPYGAGETGTDPVFRQLPVPRAREDAPDADPESLLAESEISEKGYRLAMWLPKESLHGFDPDSETRLGFYLAVQDQEFGSQSLTVSDEFPYDADPSQWVSLEFQGS